MSIKMLLKVVLCYIWSEKHPTLIQGHIQNALSEDELSGCHTNNCIIGSPSNACFSVEEALLKVHWSEVITNILIYIFYLELKIKWKSHKEQKESTNWLYINKKAKGWLPVDIQQV